METGADPKAEFGPVGDFAEQLAGAPTAQVNAGPAADADTWRWTADAFHDLRLLNEFGAQGWELERIDRLGRFVSRRDRQRPQRWDYHRETFVGPGSRTVERIVPDIRVTIESRPAVTERLAPDGWEPCGRWMCFEYFKRPVAASVGPAAELSTPPGRPARSYFWTERGKRWIAFAAGYLVFLIVFLIGVGYLMISQNADDGFVRGVLWGWAIGLVLGVVVGGVLWVRRRRRTP